MHFHYPSKNQMVPHSLAEFFFSSFSFCNASSNDHSFVSNGSTNQMDNYRVQQFLSRLFLISLFWKITKQKVNYLQECLCQGIKIKLVEHFTSAAYAQTARWIFYLVRAGSIYWQIFPVNSWMCGRGEKSRKLPYFNSRCATAKHTQVKIMVSAASIPFDVCFNCRGWWLWTMLV